MNYAYPSGLPVELVSFDARLLNNEKVDLQWVTQTEKDNAHFTLQRSIDGIQFEKLVETPAGNQATGGTYEWVDQHPQPGVNYYMLSQTDFDGDTKHLGIKSVNVLSANPIVRIIPNPVEAGTLRFRVDLPAAFDGITDIVDQDGRVLASFACILEKGSTWVQQSLQGLLPGVYTLRMNDGQQQFSARFTK